MKRRNSDPNAVKTSYDAAWTQVRKRLTDEIATGDHVSSILARMERLNLGPHYPSFARSNRYAAKIQRQTLSAFGVADDVDPMPYFCNVANGRYVIQSGLNETRYISGGLKRENQVIVELGSGWSANLFKLYVLLGSSWARSVRFFAGEFTDAGRECGEMLASHVPDIDYTSFAFDYTRPDLRVLDGVAPDTNVTIFSKHSIEQVPDVDVSVLDDLRRRFDTVRVIHFEPIGWQRYRDLWTARMNDDDDVFESIAEKYGLEEGKSMVPYLQLADGVREQVEVAAWWSYVSGYNRNWLRALRGAGVAMRQVLYDYDAIGNPLNPSTLIAYDLQR